MLANHIKEDKDVKYVQEGSTKKSCFIVYSGPYRAKGLCLGIIGQSGREILDIN